MNSVMCGFKIDGEFITTHSRNLVIEGKIREAERFLLEGIVGLNHKDMQDILAGKKKFVGFESPECNTLELVDDDDINTQLIFKQLFAGIVYNSNYYWMPYAMVVGWGPRDLGAGEIHNHPMYNYGSTVPPDLPGGSKIVKFSQSRNVAYMDNKQQDLQHVLIVDGSTTVTLWKRVDPPPFWVKIVNDSNWQKGLDEFFGVGKKLSVRCHTTEFGEGDFKFFPSKNENQTDPITQLRNKIKELNVKDDTINELLKDSVPEHAVTGMSQLYSDYVDDSIPVPIVDNSMMHDVYHGYILKDGRFFACEYHHHAALATRIFKHIFNREVEDSEKEADDAGWIRIQKSAITDKYNCIICKRPTNEQMSTFLFWGAIHGVGEDELQMYI